MAETKDANNGFVPVQIALVVIKDGGQVWLTYLTGGPLTANRIIILF